uniref:Uncharacterized protein n=1 Tax=Anguilla anguilla TaxID=7936 RepID=A0A0E9RDX1_ANGAN
MEGKVNLDHHIQALCRRHFCTQQSWFINCRKLAHGLGGGPGVRVQGGGCVHFYTVESG